MRRFGVIPPLALGAVSLSFATVVFDQLHDGDDVFEAYHNIAVYAPVAQEVTPALGALNFVDVWTRDLGPPGNGLGARLVVHIRSSSVDGPILATSLEQDLPDGTSEPVRFTFPAWVPLEIGTPVFIQLVLLEGDMWAVHSHGQLFPGYPGGRYFLGGHPQASFDMWFRTGVRGDDQPHIAWRGFEALCWRGIPPLAYRLRESGDLANWSEGTVLVAAAIDNLLPLGASQAARFFRLEGPLEAALSGAQ